MVGFPTPVTESLNRAPLTSEGRSIIAGTWDVEAVGVVACANDDDPPKSLERQTTTIEALDNNDDPSPPPPLSQQKKITQDASAVELDPEIVKKVAAYLKSPRKSMRKEVAANDLSGSLSSGCSIETITSSMNDKAKGDECSIGMGGGGGGGDGGSEPGDFNRSSRLSIKSHRKFGIDEKWYQTTLQVSVPFFIAGIGTIGAGLVLSTVTTWPVFIQVSQLLILVPSLLGLKGNLDMCLASRLCTQANLGNMKCIREIVKMIIGNVALVQIQAIVAAVIVSIFAMTVHSFMSNTFVWNHGILLAASSVCTATSSCFVLDFVMVAVIMLSYRCKMNPDNLATPLAASVGDVVSITLLSQLASFFFDLLDTKIWILYVILGFYLLMLPIWIVVVLKNKYTRNVLTSGWVPVLSALFISGLGGLILDQVNGAFKGFVIFQPIINGLGGNLVSIQASRISTMLHQTTLMGILPPHSQMWVSPWKALINGVPSAKSARILIGMAIPGHLTFTFLADYIKWGHSTLQIYFVASYLFVAVVQVMFLLYIAHLIIHAMWRRKIDPDNSAIPYLTAMGDLTGSCFLALAFYFLQEINKPYAAVDMD